MLTTLRLTTSLLPLLLPVPVRMRMMMRVVMRVVRSVLGSFLRVRMMLWMKLSRCSMCRARVYRALSAAEAMTLFFGYPAWAQGQ